MTRTSLLSVLALGVVLAGCSKGSTSGAGGSPAPSMSTTPPSPDPRVGLKAGFNDAGVAAWNIRLISNVPSPAGFQGVSNSDLAFKNDLVFQGNYNGFNVWDIKDPKKPKLVKSFLCPASQSDVSVFGNLLFVSGEGLSGRLDCAPGGIKEGESHLRLRGIRIFDATDIQNPKYIGNVQTCRGSHTHTVVRDLKDPSVVYVYVSGSAGVRPASELAGCSDRAPDQDPNSALFRIEVIKVPLANPSAAEIVSSPRIFQGLAAPPIHAASDSASRAAAMANRNRTGPTQCHDITVYPAIGLAGGACGGYGLLLDISDPANPKRLSAAADSNFSFWHSATFSNDGSKILFTDEWGGGSAPRCRSTDKYEWGANAIFTIENRHDMRFKSYYKMPAAQTIYENCVAHNGSLIPVPGREIMVQGWYQGGISVFDWTDPAKPFEIAYYDRGPVDSTKLANGGSWSVYWYNGYLVNSEISRGLDIYELVPSGLLSQNEIDAARTVRLTELNAQEQPKFVWPPSFALARAYLDQLERDRGLAGEKIASARSELAKAEKASGQARKDALTALSTRLHGDARGAAGEPKVHALASAVGDLAK